MSKIILMAESGSDITPEQAKQNGIVIVPMHVSFGGETRDDGAFPTTEMFDFYKKHRELPRTSGCTPHDFEAVFERLDREYPDASILYLAYSASTTCSMQSALIAGEGRERFVAIDTKSVAAGQAAVVLTTARYLREHPEATLEEAAAFVNGATFSERAAALANGATSATRAAVTVSLRAEILSGGVVSDSRDARLYIPADETAPRGFAGADAVSAALAAEIGANALCAPDASRARMAAAEHELAFIPYHSLAIQRAARACQRYEALLRLAGDESRVLDPALWRLTGCDMDAPELSSLLSSDGDFEEVCRRSRYRQAIALRDAAEHARMKRVPFLLDGAKDDAPTCLSGALFDLDGAARPAYFALADAWKSEHAFVLPPESFPADGIVSVPVFYLSDEKMPPCTVNVRAYSMDGQELITAGFPVPGRATDVIGRLCVEMPEDGLLLLRASVLRDGACVSRSDRLITLNEACLSALRPVQLLPDAATLRNASNTVAVGVSVPAAHYFGALLPGETLPLGEPRLTGFETLNPLL